MTLPRLGVIATLLMAAAALGTGIAFRGLSAEPEPQTQDLAPHADLATLEKPIQQHPAFFWDQSEVPVNVWGQVLDPHGKPLAGAELYVGYSARRFARRSLPEKVAAEQTRPGSIPRRATTDADGRFQFRFATAELDPLALDDARPAVIAIAAGYGPEWMELNPSSVEQQKLPD